jgi:hypothetical protein
MLGVLAKLAELAHTLPTAKSQGPAEASFAVDAHNWEFGCVEFVALRLFLSDFLSCGAGVCGCVRRHRLHHQVLASSSQRRRALYV